MHSTSSASSFQKLRQVLPKKSWVKQATRTMAARVAAGNATLYGPKLKTEKHTIQTQSPAERLGLDNGQTISAKQASLSVFSRLPWVKSAAVNQQGAVQGLNFTQLLKQLKIQKPTDGIHDYKQVAANFNSQLKTLINTHNFTKEQKANLELLSRSAILPLLEVACQYLSSPNNNLDSEQKTEFINTLVANILNNTGIDDGLQKFIVGHDKSNAKSDGLAYFAKNFLKANAKSEIVKNIVIKFSDANKTAFANNIHHLAEKSGNHRNHFTGGKAFDLTLRYTTHGKALKSIKNFYGKSYTMVAVRLAAIAKTAFVAGVIAEPINFSSLNTAVDGLGTTINSAVNGAHGFFANTLPSGIEHAWNATGDGLSNAAQTVSDGLSNAASAVSDGFGDAAAAIGDALNNAYGADTFAAKSSAVLTGIGGAAALFAGGLLGKNIQKRKLAAAIDAYQTEKNPSAQDNTATQESPSTTDKDALAKLLAKYGKSINDADVQALFNNQNADIAKILKENFIKKTVGGATKVLTRGTVNTSKAIRKGGLITLGAIGTGAMVTGKAVIKGTLFTGDRLAGVVTSIAGNAAYRFASDFGRGTGANAAVKSLNTKNREKAQIAFAHQQLGINVNVNIPETDTAPRSITGGGFLKGIKAGLSKAVAGASTFATGLRGQNATRSEPRALAADAEHVNSESRSLGGAPSSRRRNFDVDAEKFPELQGETQEQRNAALAEFLRQHPLPSQPSLDAVPANTAVLDSDDEYGTPPASRRDGMSPFSATRPVSDGQPPLNPLAQPSIPAQAPPSAARVNSAGSFININAADLQTTAQLTGEQSEITDATPKATDIN